MKTKMKAVRPVRSKSYLKQKLISAAALLLLSSIMLVSSSYAWYVLSTAPEAANIKTQVGANGALEIALLNEASWENLELLDMGDIDESAVGSVVSALSSNLTWGNLIDLDNAAYGLDNVVLQPSRLFISKEGDDYKVNQIMLKTPVYGEDGRVEGLETTSVAWTYQNGSFSNPNGYGVRAVGTSASMSVFQLGMNAARSALMDYARDARIATSEVLSATGGSLANIVVAFAVSDKNGGFTKGDVENIKALAEGLKQSMVEIENALRQVFAGYITTKDAYYVDSSGETPANVLITSENYQLKLAEITDPSMPLSMLRSMYPGVITVVQEFDSHLEKFTKNKNDISNAVSQCDTLINGAETEFTWDQLARIISPLVDTTDMKVNDRTIEQLQADLIMKDEETGESNINLGAALNLVRGGITILVPPESGILGDIADFAGRYTAEVKVTLELNIEGFEELNGTEMDVDMTTAPINPTYLTTCSSRLQEAVLAEDSGNDSITDCYGYAIDLAFRTNAVESNLLLQTEGTNRIYEGDTQNPTLQGGGSYMSFTATASLSATKMIKLMSGIRVVLMDREQKILGIAVLDCTLGQDVYTLIPEGDRTDEKYAYLDVSAGAYKNSDVISKSKYEDLEENSGVIFDELTGKVTAKLYLYEFELTRSATSTEKEIKYTGGITIGDKIDDGVITALTQDVIQQVTVLVYLDGSVVNNSTVAADSTYSMTGTLNLQFASDADLRPAVNTQLRTDTTGVIYTELEGLLYQNGYLSYETLSDGTILGKINSGYEIYTGSDGKTYFRDAASETPAYTELTPENVGTVVSLVTAALSSDKSSIAEGEKATLTVSLDGADENLTITEYKVVASEGANDIAEIGMNADGSFTVTGVGEGTVTYKVTVIMKAGKGDGTSMASCAVTTNEVTVNVTASSTDTNPEG